MIPQHARHWCRWLLACGLPPEHVATVLGVDLSEVVSLTAVRYLTASDAHPVGPPRKPSPSSSVGGQAGRYVRTLARLGYDAARIAKLLSIKRTVVADFLRRLEPVRTDDLRRPRGRSEEARLRSNQARAAAREERRRIHTPPAGWSNGHRFTTGEAAEWADFVTALKEARVSGANILGLASRLWYAPPRSRPEAPPVEPVIWVGPENPRIGTPKLTPDMIAELKVLRAQGWSTGKLAKRYGVARSTICYVLLGRTFRELRPSDSSPLQAQTPPNPAPAPSTAPARAEHPQPILPSPTWSKGEYFLTGEQSDWEQFQASAAAARERDADIIGASSGRIHGPHQSRPEAPPVEPVIWIGPNNYYKRHED